MRIANTFFRATTLACTLVAGTSAEAATPTPSAFAKLQGDVLVDNARVHVEKFVLHPGQSTGPMEHSADHLLVFTKGGVLKSTSGRSTLWKDGRVLWRGASAVEDPSLMNTGGTDIEIVCVGLKPAAAGAAASPASYLNYPNIPGEDILENDAVIVQRFTVNPGQWEGVHAHHPNMLWIHIKGGQWAARTKAEPEHPYPHPSADGSVGWMEPVDLSVGHESGNIGKDPIDLIWVTLKK